MLVSCGATTPASDMVVATEVALVLERRSALAHPPVTLAVSDAVALGIAGILRSPTASGTVLGRFHRTGAVDTGELIEACRTEQDYSSAESHAALYCLIGWARAHVYQQGAGTRP